MSNQENEQQQNTGFDVYGGSESIDLGSSENSSNMESFFDSINVDNLSPDFTTPNESDNIPIERKAANENDDTNNLIEQAFKVVEEKANEETKKSLFSKLPIFKRGAAKDPIEDTSITFEDLRIEKANDFPELEDSKRVTWTVTYGITKNVSDPKGTTIAKMKSDIETSKEFLDALKKVKNKEPECLVEPKVAAQTKGKIPAYKGVFPNLEVAEEAGKVISILPARDGKVYEIRKNEVGTFTIQSIGNSMLSDICAGFIPALPKVPIELLLGTISFFRVMAIEGDFEALVNIYWDKVDKEYVIDVPKQTVTPVSVNTIISDFDESRYVHYMDIHSHNRMKAYFSKTDDEDEKAARIYVVIGEIFNYFPSIKTRICSGGQSLEIKADTVFEGIDFYTDIPFEWIENVKTMDKKSTHKNTNRYEFPNLLTTQHTNHCLGGEDV